MNYTRGDDGSSLELFETLQSGLKPQSPDNARFQESRKKAFDGLVERGVFKIVEENESK